MELVLAYGAGVLTLINPCILPVLPIVLASALQSSRFGPAALAAGMGLSFVVVGLGVTAAGHAFGLREETVARAGAVLMIGFGLVLLVPRFSAGFATATAGMAARADAGIDRIDRSLLPGQFLGGMLLGAVWSPCIGPTLGGAVALAARGERLIHAGLVMTAFALGVATVVLILAHGARGLLARLRAPMLRLAGSARPLMGAVFLTVGAAMLGGVHLRAEAWLLDRLPDWLVDLSVSL